MARWWIACVLVAVGACRDAGHYEGDVGFDADLDGDSADGNLDGDADADSDGDADSDADGDTDGDSGGDADGDGDASCAETCALALTCETATDLDLLFGTSEAECESRCASLAGEAWVWPCAASASSCEDVAECTRCLTWDDVDFCRDGACDLLVTTCGGTDVDQCTIDCEMIGSGATGCFRGAGRDCWLAAVAAEDCDLAASCPTIH